MKILLKEWAARNFSPVPHRNTLVNWIKAGHIAPMPVFIGRAYYVEETAKYIADKIEAPKRPDLKPDHARGFSFILLGWAANARRRAMEIKPALPMQGDLFGAS